MLLLYENIKNEMQTFGLFWKSGSTLFLGLYGGIQFRPSTDLQRLQFFYVLDNCIQYVIIF